MALRDAPLAYKLDAIALLATWQRRLGTAAVREASARLAKDNDALVRDTARAAFSLTE